MNFILYVSADWPCMTVSGASGSGRHIEVLVELAQDGTICVKSDVGGDQEQCKLSFFHFI